MSPKSREYAPTSCSRQWHTIFADKMMPVAAVDRLVHHALIIAVSSLRVEVEQQIGGIKRCQVVVQKFRNRKDHYVDDVMETACGLHNFRICYRQQSVKQIGIAA